MARDALLARDAGARVHICHASTAGTVELVRWARSQGIAISAEVTPHHLLLDDSIRVEGRGAARTQLVGVTVERRARAASDDPAVVAAREAVERWGEPAGGATLSVVGLGKLGGRELGYHSDLDLVFLYGGSGEPDLSSGGTRGRLGAAEYFTRLAQRLIAHLQVPLREGTLYRIDTRLRPPGSRGALVVSLPALAAYHRKEAALWERQALLKARHVAGDAALFARAQAEVIVPAVFRPDADPAALGAAIADMRRRLEEQASGEGRGEKNPKTGYGGLVDVEFAVQYLQLLHGAARPAIRTPSTPEAITRLGAAGLLAPVDERLLTDAYRYLRRLELRLRIVHDFGISRLPAPGRELSALARRLGHGGERGGESLLSEYARVTAAVREAFRRLVPAP